MAMVAQTRTTVRGPMDNNAPVATEAVAAGQAPPMVLLISTKSGVTSIVDSVASLVESVGALAEAAPVRCGVVVTGAVVAPVRAPPCHP